MLIIWDSHGRYAPSEWRNLYHTLSHLSLYPHPLWLCDFVTLWQVNNSAPPIFLKLLEKKMHFGYWQRVFNSCIFAAWNKGREFKEIREVKEVKEVKEDKEIKEIRELKEIKDYPP